MTPPAALRRRAVALGAGLALLVATPIVPSAAAAPTLPRPPDATTSRGAPVDLDALFIGAHPDDEAFTLATFGQLRADQRVRTGVITVTRGEGGGNAVGPEEGPALGLIREAEERAAVGTVGLKDVFNLDKVDFYYTVSEPLTRQIWGHDETLAKVVRIVRQTRPELLFTMNPAPSPGNHGNHQEAARLAIEAFYAAADPTAFPEQLAREHLHTWAPSRILLGGGASSAPGPQCSSVFTPTVPTSDVYGVWTGRQAPSGQTWAQLARIAQRKYASQGWAGFPDVPSDPNQLGCNFFTQVDSRVPFPAPGTPAAAAQTGLLDGALTRSPGTVPLGTGFRLGRPTFDVRAGSAFALTATVTAPRRTGLGASRVQLSAPAGWRVFGNGRLGHVRAGRSATTTFLVRPAAGAVAGSRARIDAQLTTAKGTGHSDTQVQVTPAVEGRQQLLPQVAQFEHWADSVGVPQLTGSVLPVLTLPSGGSRTVGVTVTNHSSTTQSGTVTVDLPAGFSADEATKPYAGLAPGDTATVSFTVTNTDTTLPTSNGGDPSNSGNYSYTITTTSNGGVDSTTTPALELVPAATVPQAATAPTVDGIESPGEYAGPALDISRRWEGAACDSAADCSATAKVTWRDDTLYVLVTVTDDVLGTKLDKSDCKRHWRTDSVEVAIDPRGTSENTSTTFKTGVLPVTAEGPPCYERDADNHQGPGAETAPGMRIASTVSSPYTGYTVEMSIPMDELPGAVDPEHMGLNILVYDSDTQDKTGQTRLGWSTWGGVQGDPYRWGIVRLPGYEPPAGRPTTAPEPIVPRDALSSLDSPQSLAQAVRIDVPLAGDPGSKVRRSGWVTRASAVGTRARVTVRHNASGVAHLIVRDALGTAGTRVVRLPGTGRTTLTVRLDRALSDGARAWAGWRDNRGGNLASYAVVR